MTKRIAFLLVCAAICGCASARAARRKSEIAAETAPAKIRLAAKLPGAYWIPLDMDLTEDSKALATPLIMTVLNDELPVAMFAATVEEDRRADLPEEARLFAADLKKEKPALVLGAFTTPDGGRTRVDFTFDDPKGDSGLPSKGRASFLKLKGLPRGHVRAMSYWIVQIDDPIAKDVLSLIKTLEIRK